MADAVVVKTLRDTDTVAAFLFGNASDGTGESAVTKIDISALKMAASRVRITKIKWACDGMQVKVLFDHNTDDLVAILAGLGEIDTVHGEPIYDPASAGGPGDILFTTAGSTTGDGYTVYMEIEKVS